jgi:hypothetical protein
MEMGISKYYLITIVISCLAFFANMCFAKSAEEKFRLTRQQVIEQTMKPYDGPSAKGVDTSTLTGKVMCGYQGWFACPDDGSEMGWGRWGKRGELKPGRCEFDLWPDMSEYDKDEKYPTDFRHKDGSVAYVYSPMNQKTILRHFKWMVDYGIDGVFVQRFARNTFGAKLPYHYNTVLNHCRQAANLYGRTYAVMYDLSKINAGEMSKVIEDWKLLSGTMKITEDAAYLHHNGKPVVTVWGIGFNDRRKYTLQECADLVNFLKNDPKYGGCTVMIGVPTWWRELYHDCVNDEKVLEIARAADIISPWIVGRFGNIKDIPGFARNIWKKDIKWCEKNNKDYIHVIFPGFSWHNLKPDSPLDQVPRLGGRFFWKQFIEAKKAGADMIYVAMYDEVNEGTAIFKCTNDPPVGESKFLTEEGIPSDHYLWLAGQGGKMVRGEIEMTEELPKRN